MKRHLLALALTSLPVAASAADVGVSVTVGQPGFYGHIDIGNVPQPHVINTTPVVIHPAHAAGQPVYMRVPPGHAKHWDKHCAEYNACGQRVYFVKEEWYNKVYVPQHGSRGAEDNTPDGERNGNDKGKNKHKNNKGHGNGRGQDRND